MFSLNSDTNLEMDTNIIIGNNSNNYPDPKYLDPVLYFYIKNDTEGQLGGIILQLTPVSGTRFIVMDMFSSTWTYTTNETSVVDIHNLIKTVYGIEINPTILKQTNDINNPDLQNVLNNINPKILLPFKIPIEYNNTIKFFRYFTRDLISETTDPNSIGPETLLLYEQITESGKRWVYFDPITGIVYGLQLPGKYTEITKDEFKKQTSRLTQKQSFSPIDTKEKFFSLLKDYLSGNIISSGRYYTKDDLIEKINDLFGKHFDFSFLQSDAQSIRIASPSIPPKLPISLLNSLYSNAIIKNRFETVNFLRSYIDLFHDILEYGHLYKLELSKSFQLKISNNPTEKLYFDKKFKEINDTIFTSSNKVSQTRCKEILELLTDEFVEFLHTNGINTIPTEKENSLVISASIDNEKEIELLIQALNNDGINGFYVESANNSIGEILVKNKFKLINLKIGEWDAGSGFTGQKMKPPPEIIHIGPPQLPNLAIDMFGTININVDADNTKLTASSTIPAGYTLSITPRQKLSVNKILKTTNNIIVRGSGDSSDAGTITTVPQINPTSDINLRTLLISLKTWTDLIQIETISKTMSNRNNKKNPIKILTVIYDGLCETTARLYGLGHVLKTEGKIVTYYNYNVNSRSLSESQIKTKTQIKKYIESNKDLFKQYLNLWFNQRINALTVINDDFYDPALYFVSELFKVKYKQAKDKSLEFIDTIDSQDIRLIPYKIDEYINSISSSSVLLGELLDSISQFNNAIQKIKEIGKRPSMDTFLNAYDFVQQQIINTFGEKDAIELRSMVACTFAYVFLKDPRGTNLAFSALQSIKIAFATAAGLSPQNRSGLITLSKANNMSANNYRGKYLPGIKIVQGELQKRLINIVDIETACRRLLKSQETYNGKPITYQDYIQQHSAGPTLPILPKFSFLNIVDNVDTLLRKFIKINQIYLGGNINYKKHRTHRRKLNKRKINKRKTHKKRN